MKILVAHASFGWGHRRAAEAIAEVLTERGINTEVRDLLEFIPPPLAYAYSRSYSLMMTHARWLWKFIYHSTDNLRTPYQPNQSLFQRWEFSAFIRYIQEQKFSHIISTHFTPSALIAGIPADELRKFTVITDYTAHRYWKTAGLDAYFVPTSQVKEQLIAAGIPSQKIQVSGIPISTRFASQSSREPLREQTNGPTSPLTIVVLTSGLNQSTIRSIIAELKQLDATFFISAGKYAPNEQCIRRICRDDKRFHIFGFHPRIWELMQTADLLLSKPGGLTTSEALAAGIPQLLFPALPGQEEGNAQFLISRGAALPIPSKRAEFRRLLAQLVCEPSILQQMRQKARLLGKPDAARSVVDAIVDLELTAKNAEGAQLL